MCKVCYVVERCCSHWRYCGHTVCHKYVSDCSLIKGLSCSSKWRGAVAMGVSV